MSRAVTVKIWLLLRRENSLVDLAFQLFETKTGFVPLRVPPRLRASLAMCWSRKMLKMSVEERRREPSVFTQLSTLVPNTLPTTTTQNRGTAGAKTEGNPQKTVICHHSLSVSDHFDQFVWAVHLGLRISVQLTKGSSSQSWEVSRQGNGVDFRVQTRRKWILFMDPNF